jgi:hypothetical protein
MKYCRVKVRKFVGVDWKQAIAQGALPEAIALCGLVSEYLGFGVGARRFVGVD